MTTGLGHPSHHLPFLQVESCSCTFTVFYFACFPPLIHLHFQIWTWLFTNSTLHKHAKFMLIYACICQSKLFHVNFPTRPSPSTVDKLNFTSLSCIFHSLLSTLPFHFSILRCYNFTILHNPLPLLLLFLEHSSVPH